VGQDIQHRGSKDVLSWDKGTLLSPRCDCQQPEGMGTHVPHGSAGLLGSSALTQPGPTPCPSKVILQEQRQGSIAPQTHCATLQGTHQHLLMWLCYWVGLQPKQTFGLLSSLEWSGLLYSYRGAGMNHSITFPMQPCPEAPPWSLLI